MNPMNGKQETRHRLLLAALSLYAREGLHGVSLRAISAASGSRNSAAMHYHFDNKAGVIRALLEMIYDEVGAIASQQQLATTINESTDLREVLRLSLMPLVSLSRDVEWGPNALVFLARLLGEADDELAAISNELSGNFYRRADAQLARLLPDQGVEVRQLRLIFMTVNVFHGFADLGALGHTPFGDLSTIEDEVLLGHLVDYLYNGLLGPSR